MLRDTCRRLVARTPVTVYCPTLVPPGPLSLGYSHADRDGYQVEVNSPMIHRSSAGHWAFGAGSPARVDSLLHPSTSRLEPSISVSKARLGNLPVTYYVLPPQLNGGGMFRGHVLYAWRLDGKEYYLTLHGHRNALRAKLMAEALIERIRRRP